MCLVGGSQYRNNLYSSYFASLIRDGSRIERRAMVVEAAKSGLLFHSRSGGGCPPSCEKRGSPEQSLFEKSWKSYS